MTFRQFAYRNVIRNRRVYAAFFMASVSSVIVFFIYSMLMFHPKIENQFLSSVAFRGMFVAEIVLVMFMAFFLYYSVNAFLEARSKEFGILIHLGMEKRQLNNLVLLEILIIGVTSIVLGILFGFAFSKFFFMIVREILQIASLPLYFSWKPFALTIGTFLSLFIIISALSVWTIKDERVIELLRGAQKNDQDFKVSKFLGLLGALLLATSYFLATQVTSNNLILFVFILPPICILGLFLFFAHTIQLIIQLMKKSKMFYWKKYRLLSISEMASMLKANATMFFMTSLVSTMAILAVGTLSSMSTFTHQYHKINPLSLVYASNIANPYEARHIHQLQTELDAQGLSYRLNRVVVKEQTSSATNEEVRILNESDLNNIAIGLGYPLVDLQKGEAKFLPYSEESLKAFKKQTTSTILQENNIALNIDGAYEEIIFTEARLGTNSIVISDEDYEKLYAPLNGRTMANSSYHIYVFNVPKWTETIDVGENLDAIVTQAKLEGELLPFYFENTGLNYSFIRSTFALLLFVGFLATTVFFLASGSFIYFKLYTNLDADIERYATLQRMGLTEKEVRKLVNRQLIPQFFLPWTVALMNSCFAFISLQVFWRGVADLSIYQEMILALILLTAAQFIYYYLIRWRYLAHIGIRI